LEGNYGISSIEGCRGKNSNEDTEIIVKENIDKIGPIELYGIFDGHSGDLSSKKMKEYCWKF
jgi:serine/threonine protein phosphatase PrpC